jgi:hypothetical protein
MKKRSSLFLVLILIVLAALSIWIYITRTSHPGSHDSEDRDFSYKDTAGITSIFIADKEGRSSHVKRTTGNWVVNEKYPCRSEAILNLLEAIRNVEVKMPVSKEARPHILKFMSANALKVEIYEGDNKVKQYYVGHETPDGEGSYMLLTDISSGKNYDDPYVCFIPGFSGYLQPRFITNENDWRDRVVMNFIPPQLRSVNVNYPTIDRDSSFTIELESTTSFRLKDATGRDLGFDNDRMKQYLAYFQNVSYEGLITGRNKKLQDSLAAVGPFCIIKVSGKDYSQHEFRFYRKSFTDRTNPELGVTFEYDPDRLYMSFDSGREWAIIQYFVFGKLLVNSSYFRTQDSVKK